VKVLLDTCVLSDLRNPRGHPGVRRAVEGLDDEDIFVSVISVGEISKGIALLRDSPKKRGLEAWLQLLERQYAERLLPIDLETSRIWGEITAAAQKAGRVLHVADGLMAATALRRGLHVMTRNTADFQPSGALVLNPWKD
jgi:toxin FitB